MIRIGNPRLQFVLIIVDGLGLRESNHANAFKLARTPVFDKLFVTYPWTRLDASGKAVGLPDDIIGNSEVGHLTIGSGRIIKQDLVRINETIHHGTLGQISELRDLFTYVKEKNSSLHLMGLLSDGGVHSHIDHLFAILKIAKQKGLDDVYLHAITDGRDTSPSEGINFIHRTLDQMKEIGIGTFATIIGRYYAMDRDHRWERTQIAYNTYVSGEGQQMSDPVAAVQSSYKKNVTDEFLLPILIPDRKNHLNIIREDDALFCFNFRADRMRQICRVLGGDTFEEFPRLMKPVFTFTLTSYDDRFTFPVLFKPLLFKNVFGEVLGNQGLHQLRIAESEKYAHVTYFFNGGNETPFPHEERILVPSPKVATYDLKPEMSAYEIRETVLEAIESERFDCIIMNLANPDMVGHTGNLEAAIAAAEVVDEVVGEVVNATLENHAVVFVTSDHGNLELMINEETDQMHTAHTMNSVPFFLIDSGKQFKLRSRGELADIAPTILDFFTIPIPEEMEGKSLLVN